MAYYDEYWDQYGWGAGTFAPPFDPYTMPDYWQPPASEWALGMEDIGVGVLPTIEQPRVPLPGIAATDVYRAPVGFGADVPVQALGPKATVVRPQASGWVPPFATLPGSGPGQAPPYWSAPSGEPPPPPEQGSGQASAGTGDGPPVPPRNPAPPGINQGWWDEFTAEHGGQSPSEFYGSQGEGLAEAMADKEWGDRFAAEHGRPPTQEEWENNWYRTRTGRDRPRGGGGDWREARKRIRAIWGQAMRDATRQKPPTFIPPGTVWR